MIEQTAGQMVTATLRRYFKIGPRTRRWRQHRDLHREVIQAIHLAATAPGYYTPPTQAALRPAFGVALGWSGQIFSCRLPGDITYRINSMTAWQMTALVGEMLDAGISNVGQFEQWVFAHFNGPDAQGGANA